MPLSALLLSRDDEVIRMLRRVLQDLAVELQVCTGSDDCVQQLSRRKFDAVIVDCDDVHGGQEALRSVRKTTSNKSSTTFAIINGITSVQNAFQMGANLAMEKPISPDRALHSFRAAQGLMEAERRRYYRYRVDMPVSLQFGKQEYRAVATNLSNGGMAVRIQDALPEHQLGALSFTLPGSEVRLELKARVAWADNEGRAGIRFEQVSSSSRTKLEKWSEQQPGGGGQ